MTAESKYLIISLLEGFVAGLRDNSFNFTDEQGDRLVRATKEILNPQCVSIGRICNITMACEYLGITQPTFRKYVKCGKIPEGKKISGFTELIWDKNDIEKFAKTWRKKK